MPFWKKRLEWFEKKRRELAKSKKRMKELNDQIAKLKRELENEDSVQPEEK